MNIEEAHLLEGCRKNDRAALHALYERYAPRMYGFLLRYTATPEEAQDLLHDGFIKVFNSIGKLKKDESLEAWMRSVMFYTAISAYRTKHTPAEIDEVEEVCNDMQQGMDEMTDGVDIAIIQHAISELPDSYRIVFNMCEVEGYPAVEASKLLGISPGTVRSNLHRAKTMLKEALTPFFPQYNQG